MMLRVSAVLGAAMLAAAAAQQAVTITPPKRVTGAPSKTGPGVISRAMASADAQSFARALAEAGHPAGFVMPIAERQLHLPADSGEMLTLDEAIGVFTARGSYRVTRGGGALVFRHVQTPPEVAGALDTPRPHYAIKGTFSLALYDVVLRGLARRPMGTVSRPEPGAGPDCQVEQPVAVPAGRATSIELMNALVTRTRGVAWLVRFGQPSDQLRLQIGYVCGNGVWSALSVPGW